jgi:NADH-quinone oxidoreductase subunit M
MLSTCIYHRSQTFDLSAMGGLATKTPVLAAFFVAGSMASIGLPGFGNFWGEFTIFASLAETETTKWIVAPAALGIIISAIYGLRAVANIFFGKPTEAFVERLEGDEIVDLKHFERVPALVLIVALIVIGLCPRMFSDAADSELQQLYTNKSTLPVIEINAALPQAMNAHQEVTH